VAARFTRLSGIPSPTEHVTHPNSTSVEHRCEHTCSRSELVEPWKQRSQDFLDLPIARVNMTRQTGGYSIHHLHMAPLFLEGLGMIARTSDEASAEVMATDRVRRVELRWQRDYHHSALTTLGSK